MTAATAIEGRISRRPEDRGWRAGDARGKRCGLYGRVIMKKITTFTGIVGTLLCLSLFAAPAHAQATRTWVSGVGDDVNPCSRTAPCKTFAGAISKVAAGGLINCLDPDGFGAVTVTEAKRPGFGSKKARDFCKTRSYNCTSYNRNCTGLLSETTLKGSAESTESARREGSSWRQSHLEFRLSI
jgi:hypothetical protein